MSRAPLVATFFAGIVSFGCQHSPAHSGNTGPAASVGPSAEPSAESEPAASATPSAAPDVSRDPIPVSDCESAMNEYDRLLSTATYECTKDKDCKCFDGMFSRARGQECGGVIDAKTQKEMDVVARKAKKMRCSNGVRCEPWTCDPICEEGRCQNGPRAKK
jgi:hypothetical protein